jgi:hypothetical protein
MQIPSLPGTSQASHWPVHARVQQTLSTQLPDAHSAAVLHAAPGSFCETHTPPAQYWPLLHSTSVMQLVALPPQSVPTHVEPVGQVCCWSFEQSPWPSQKATKVAALFTHEGCRQTTPRPG